MKPDAPTSFTCPFCRAVSPNPHDVAQRYCVRCHVFVDDAIAKRDELGACTGHATIPIRTMEHMEQCRACETEVRHDLVDHEFFGFRAGCVWGER
jgi:hypothetical protein